MVLDLTKRQLNRRQHSRGLLVGLRGVHRLLQYCRRDSHSGTPSERKCNTLKVETY